MAVKDCREARQPAHLLRCVRNAIMIARIAGNTELWSRDPELPEMTGIFRSMPSDRI
jgi:hypothetical protein